VDPLEEKIVAVHLSWQRISLKGVKDKLSSCHKLKARKLKSLLRKEGVAQMIHLCQTQPNPPTESILAPIQTLVDSHAHLFKEPDSLPPPRAFDHHIPLLSGVKPVNIKPYRYSPS